MLRPLPGFRDFALEANHLTFFFGGGWVGGKHHFRKKNFLQTDFERKENLVRKYLPYTMVLLGRFHSTKTTGLKFSVKYSTEALEALAILKKSPHRITEQIQIL